MTLLDEKTKISLYALAVCAPSVFGGVLWLASIDAKATSAETLGATNQSKIEIQTGLLIDIKERIIRLETLMQRANKQKE